MKCKHRHPTLCTHTQTYNLGTDDEPIPYLGSFVAYQCDDCGMVLRTNVPREDLDQPTLPQIDEGMWEQAIRSVGAYVHRDTDELAAAQFFAKAMGR